MKLFILSVLALNNYKRPYQEFEGMIQTLWGKSNWSLAFYWLATPHHPQPTHG